MRLFSTLPAGRASTLQAALLCVPLLASNATAQGRDGYLNVETIVTNGIATVDPSSTTRLLLACNTPASQLQIINRDNGAPIVAIPVGLEPNSITVDGDRVFVTNFLGDSVTIVRLEGELDEFGETGTFRAYHELTRNVGDEPMESVLADIAGVQKLIVSLNTSSSVAVLDPDTLAVEDVVPIVFDTVDAHDHGLKEPHDLAVRDGYLYVLAFKGGQADTNHNYDLARSSLAGPLSFEYHGRFANTTNYAMEFSSAGDLFVVGGEARIFDANTEPEARDLSDPDLGPDNTGFFRSTALRLAQPGAPGHATVPAASAVRDLNKEADGSIVDANTDAGVQSKRVALAQPNDLAILEDATGAVERIFIAGMSQDRICTLSPPTGAGADPSDFTSWERGLIFYPSAMPAGSMRGPRSLVVGQDDAGQDELYVLNRIDNSVYSFNADTGAPGWAVGLDDPSPDHIKNGRKFLYDAGISGSGFVSCSSCHTDGRTDALNWRLGVPENPEFFPSPDDASYDPDLPNIFDLIEIMGGPTNTSDHKFIQFILLQGTLSATEPDPPLPPPLPGEPENPFLNPTDDKREMVTQSLQGLLNFDSPPESKDFMSNAPYHWRGDRRSFLDFNGAFVGLMGAADVGTQSTQGLSEADMEAFENFIFSISYPPNPQQRKDRTLSAQASAGQVVYHEKPLPETVAGRSCVQCHTLPEGSNNRLTVFTQTGVDAHFVSDDNRQPIESAALRGLLQKEGILQSTGNDGFAPGEAAVVGSFGLNHNGTQFTPGSGMDFPPELSINTFLDIFAVDFAADPLAFDDINDVQSDPDFRSVKQYVHEFDWGVAPVVGTSAQLSHADLGGSSGAWVTPAEWDADLALILEEADQANAAAVAFLEFNGTTFGLFWYPHTQLWYYSLDVNGTTEALYEYLNAPGDSLRVMSVPLGNERRLAAMGGIPLDASPPTPPASLVLEPAVPIEPNETIPTLTGNWSIDSADPNPFVYAAAGGSDAPFLTTMRLFQYGLTFAGYLPGLRHEAPRRLRVSGSGIAPGAVLRLSFLNPDAPPPLAPPAAGDPLSSFDVVTLELPLHACIDPNFSGAPGSFLWETAAEIEPIVLYTWMLGGIHGDGVQDVLDWAMCENIGGTACADISWLPSPSPLVEPLTSSTAPFNPTLWNRVHVEVVNPNGSTGEAGWVELTLE